jgi:hypothetical protein
MDYGLNDINILNSRRCGKGKVDDKSKPFSTIRRDFCEIAEDMNQTSEKTKLFVRKKRED